ncbi:hypothetical protein BEI_1021 [Halomonas beimenensis]|uniref:Uncharacterized protein n=1 Tax=Halomonas beimenensis TaxID=475662 RepID=A0A291P573_9GAMM|nr:hypothetical protein BEI_1021 [Halomonas beimenensis]
MSLRRARPPRRRVVEYHVIWRGRLVSGRVRLDDLDQQAPVSQVVRRMPR